MLSYLLIKTGNEHQRHSDTAFWGPAPTSVIYLIKTAVLKFELCCFCNKNMKLQKSPCLHWPYLSMFTLSVVCFGHGKPGATVSICIVSDMFGQGSGCGKAAAANWWECVNGYICVYMWGWNNTQRLSSDHTDSLPTPAVPPHIHTLQPNSFYPAA